MSDERMSEFPALGISHYKVLYSTQKRRLGFAALYIVILWSRGFEPGAFNMVK